MGGFNSISQAFDTIADLRARRGAPNASVRVLGYHEPGDGGGSFMFWDNSSTEVDNGGTIIQPAVGAGSGRWKMVFSGPVNVKWFGAKGDGATDDWQCIQDVIDAGYEYLYFPAGTYMVSKSIVYAKSDPLYDPSGNFARNGIRIEGESENTVSILALPGFTGVYILKLDGNASGNTDNHSPVGIVGVHVSNLTLGGLGRTSTELVRGVNIRALWYSVFSNLIIRDVKSNGVLVTGVTLAGKDDADTSAHCTFNNVHINNCGEIGFSAVYSRTGNFVFNSCTFKRCLNDGVRVSFANIVFIGCAFANNGSQSTGNLRVFKSVTGARNRGLSIQGCMFERGNKYDLKIDHLTGGKVSETLFHPYNSLAASPNTIEIGGDGVNTFADTLTFDTIRIQDYSIPIIPTFNISQGKNIEIRNVSFQEYPAGGVKYIISPDVQNVNLYRDNPNLKVRLDYGSYSNIADITGDGTLVSFASLVAAALAPIHVDFDFGDDVDTASGTFTTKTSGYYQVSSIFTLSNISSSHDRADVVIVVDGVEEVINSVPLSVSSTTISLEIPASEAKYIPGGSIVSVGIKVFGGTKTVSLMRNTLYTGNYFNCFLLI